MNGHFNGKKFSPKISTGFLELKILQEVHEHFLENIVLKEGMLSDPICVRCPSQGTGQRRNVDHSDSFIYP